MKNNRRYKHSMKSILLILYTLIFYYTANAENNLSLTPKELKKMNIIFFILLDSLLKVKIQHTCMME